MPTGGARHSLSIQRAIHDAAAFTAGTACAGLPMSGVCNKPASGGTFVHAATRLAVGAGRFASADSEMSMDPVKRVWQGLHGPAGKPPPLASIRTYGPPCFAQPLRTQ